MSKIEIDENQCLLLSGFIEEHWRLFTVAAESKGFSDDDIEQLYSKLSQQET